MSRKSPIQELDELLKDCGVTVTFDRFRDITKGCGPHCKAWAVGPRTEWCPNHKAAIERGEYLPKVDLPDKDKREYDRIEARIEKLWGKKDNIENEIEELLKEQGKLLSKFIKSTPLVGKRSKK